MGVLDMLLYIWNDVMTKRHDRHGRASKSVEPYSSHAMSLVRSIQDDSRQWRCQPSSNTSGRVFLARNRYLEYVVTIYDSTGTCTCGIFQNSRYPCVHGWAFLTQLRKGTGTFIAPFYSQTAWEQTYSIPLPPILYQGLKSDPSILPPLEKRRKGRNPVMRQNKTPRTELVLSTAQDSAPVVTPSPPATQTVRRSGRVMQRQQETAEGRQDLGHLTDIAEFFATAPQALASIAQDIALHQSLVDAFHQIDADYERDMAEFYASQPEAEEDDVEPHIPPLDMDLKTWHRYKEEPTGQILALMRQERSLFLDFRSYLAHLGSECTEWEDDLWVAEAGVTQGRRWGLTKEGVEAVRLYKRWISEEVTHMVLNSTGRHARRMDDLSHTEWHARWWRTLLDARHSFDEGYGCFSRQGF